MQPEIRFKGFDEMWEQFALRSIGYAFSGLSGKNKSDFGHGTGRYITYMNVYSNAVASNEMLEPIEVDNRQSIVKYGDIFFTVSSETPQEVGMSSVWKYDYENIYLNSFCFGFRLTKKFDLSYLAYLLRADSVRSQIVLLAQGISRYNISKRAMMDIELSLPNSQEQQKIGEFFQSLDQSIALQEEKLSKTQNLKKAMLEKMFPQEGSKQPKIRFNGFSGDWEEKRLKEIIVLLKDGTHASHPDGKDAFLLSAKNIKNGKIVIDELKDRKISIYDYDSIYKNYRIEQGDLLLTIVGTIGETALYECLDYKVAFQRSVAIIRCSKIIFPFFLLSSFCTHQLLKQLVSSASMSAQAGVYLNDLEKLTLIFPSFKEQEKIGAYFKQLDETIALQAEQLEKLKHIKKAYLAKMFV